MDQGTGNNLLFKERLYSELDGLADHLVVTGGAKPAASELRGEMGDGRALFVNLYSFAGLLFILDLDGGLVA